MSTMVASAIWTSAGTGVSEVNPIFKFGDYVYIKTEYVDGADDFNQNPYKVIAALLQDDGTNVVAADGTTTADSTGGLTKSTTDEDSANDTSDLYAWFYVLENVESGRINDGFTPESDLKTLAGVKARVGAASAAWTDPS